MRLKVILIRHGESEANQQMRSITNWLNPKFYLRGFDPEVRDPALTEKGQEQSTTRGHLLKPYLDENPKNTIIVTSPLLRAVQTCNLMLKNAGVTTSETLFPPAIALPAIKEISASSGDLGTPLESLKKRHTDFLDFSQIPEKRADSWWLPEMNDKDPKTNKKYTVNSYRPNFFDQEAGSEVTFRMGKTIDFLTKIDESGYGGMKDVKTVIMFGHSMFWKKFLSTKLPNTGIAECVFDGKEFEVVKIL